MAGLYFAVGADFQKLQQLKKDLDDLKSKLKGMDSAADKKAFDALNRKLQQTQKEYDVLAGKLSRYNAEQNRAARATDNASDSLLNYIKKGAALAGITFGVDKIKDLGSEIINVRNQFQQLEIAFGTMLKSKDKAATLMKDLTKFAAETPFGLQSAASGAKQLLAYGSTADTVIKELTMLGDVAAGTGQQIGDLVYLYGTLRTQGRAYLMDIRQFAGRGIPIYDELAKVLNTSKDKVNDFVSAGKVGFKEVELAFKNMTAQGGLYGGLMEQQSKSIGGRLEALKDNIDSIFNTIGKDSEGVIYKSIDALNTLVENYEAVGKILLGLVATYGTYRTAVMLAAIAESGWTVTQMAHFRALVVVEKAQKLVNATMLNNPYVLAATLLIGLVAAVWALNDSTTAQEKAQAKLNSILDETKTKKEELRGKSNELISIINSETKSIQEQIIAYKELQKEHQKYLGNKSFEDFKKLSPKEQQQLIDKSAFELSDTVINESLTKYKRLQDALNNRSGGLKGVNEGVSLLKDISKELGVEGASADYIRRTLSDTIKLLEKQKNIRDQASSEAGKEAKAYQDQIFSATKNVQDLKTELKNLQSGIIPADYTNDPSFDFAKSIEDKAKSLKEAEDKLSYLLNGKSSSGQSKEDKAGETAADKAKKLQQELKALQAKLSNEQLRQKLDSKQKEIDADEEGFNKQLKQNALNYEKELQQIKEFEDDKTKERAEAILKFGKDKVSVQLPELSESNIKAQVEKLKQDALSAFNKSDNDVFKKITEQYQSYADQRLDIEKKFNKDIDTLIKLREKAQEKGDKEAVNKLNRSIAKATTDKGKDLISFDFERMKEAPEYIRAFEDLGTTSTETLNSLLGQFEKFKEEAAKTLSPKDLREYTATIQSIADELSNRDLYSSLIKQKDEAVKANQRLIKAENDLRLVQLGIGDPLLTEEEAIKRVNKAKDEYYNKNKKVLDTQKKIRDQVSGLAKEMSNLGSALGGTSGEIISFIGDITSFYTTASEGIEKVSQTGAQAISMIEKASVILTIISTAIQLMKELNSILPDAFNQYEKYDEKIERINDMRDAVNEYEIAVLKANQAENSWFGNDSLRNLKDYKELQTKIFDSYRDKMLEEQAIYENKGSGGWLTNSLKSAVSWVSKITYGFDLLNKKYKEGTTAAVNNLRIETRKKSSGFLGSGIGGKSQKTEDLVTWTKKNLGFDLFDAEGWINKEAYDAIVSKYGDKLVGQTKETLDELKALRDQYDEYLNQLHEYVSSLYEPLVDNMVDSIWDWFDEGKNALDSFKDYAKQTFRDIVSDMIKTILLKDVFKDFKDNIAKLYEEYSKGNLTEAQLSEAVAKETNAVMDRYKTQLPAIQGMVDTINKNLKDTTGIDLNKSTSYSQSSSKGSFETITQDQAGEMNGRLSGILETNIRSEGYLKSISEWNKPISEKIDMSSILMPLNLIKESSTKIEQMIEENKSIAIHSYYELRDINKNTKELYQIREDIASFKKDGIKIK